MKEKFMNKKFMNEKFMNKKFTNEKFMNEKFMNENFFLLPWAAHMAQNQKYCHKLTLKEAGWSKMTLWDFDWLPILTESC